jgi:hypothetical protein
MASRLFPLLLCVLIPSCKDQNGIAVYRVSKGDSEISAPDPGMSGGMPPMATPAGQTEAPQQPSVTETAPARWEKQPPTPMRLSSYRVKGADGSLADISLVILSGEAGGVLENVNRWRGQIGQPPLSQEQLARQIQHVAAPVGDVLIVDLVGLPPGADPTKDGRIVAGIAADNGGTLFFKMRGNAALAEAQKGAFLKWIGTVRISAENPAPAKAPPGSSMENPGTPGAEAKPSIAWTTPGDWKPVPPGAMRYAEFSVRGANNETGNVSVSVFQGAGGGDLENVNRWRGQIGLPPLAAGELASLLVPLDAGGERVASVDMSGPKGRVLAAWRRSDGNVWFFKLTAPDALAGAQKPAFVKFLQSVQLHP